MTVYMFFLLPISMYVKLIVLSRILSENLVVSYMVISSPFMKFNDSLLYADKPAIGPIQSKMNPVHTLILNFLKIH
jgi:hypothetical protein